MRLRIAHTVERVFKGAQAVIEGRVGILIGDVGVRDRGKMDKRIRVELADQAADHLIIADVDDVDRYSGVMQEIEPVVHELEIQFAVRNVVHVAGECVQVVDLKAVDDLDLGAEPLQGERQVMSDKAGTASDGDFLARELISHFRLRYYFQQCVSDIVHIVDVDMRPYRQRDGIIADPAALGNVSAPYP